MNRYDKKVLLVDHMTTWDYSTLLNWAQDTMDMILDALSDKELEHEYQMMLAEDEYETRA